MQFRALARALVAGFMLAAASPLALSPAAAGDTTGLVSFYGPEAKNPTGCHGERFIPDSRAGAHTCASYQYACDTLLRVTDLATKRSVECRINDRGPARRLHRLVDLSRGAGRDLGILERGVVSARVEIIGHRKGPGRGRP